MCHDQRHLLNIVLATGKPSRSLRARCDDALRRPTRRPVTGREAIATGYASQPPSDTLTVTRADSSGDVDELWFAWDNGSTGTMILRWSGDLIAELTVTFS
ncbi:MAG: uncharacterized protein QOJ73_932 [Streptosporangiaceae bacterium]|nr:uncharacterized protein [Streptosporangiaceae bacterium]